MFLAATNRNPVASVGNRDAGTVEAQVALLEKATSWLTSRPTFVTREQARRLSQAADKLKTLQRDNSPDLSVGDWVLFDERPHLVRSIRTNPWTGDVLHVRLTAESGKTRDAPRGRGLEKIR